MLPQRKKKKKKTLNLVLKGYMPTHISSSKFLVFKKDEHFKWDLGFVLEVLSN